MLHLYAADRVGPLAAQLAEVYLQRPADPFAPEWVAVPSVGMRRWLSLELARHLGAADGRDDGVAANIEFGFPGELRSRVFRAARPDDDPDPWAVARLTWAVLQVADERPDDPLLTALTHPAPGVARFGVARRMADLLDRYHVHRPEMVRRWAAGDLVDGNGAPLPASYRWQPHLWALCKDVIGQDSPAEQLPGLLHRLRTGHLDLGADLPERLALFGLTQLPGGSGFVELAGAVAAGREVHVYLLEPSTAVRPHLATTPGTAASLVRSEDDSLDRVHHPLLRSWGRQHRETAVLLADAAVRGDLPVPTDLTTPTDATGPATLLHRLQTDLRADRAPARDLPLPGSDGSLRIHACYGATRQVEVLRDALLHLLADPELGLAEDDIVVLCPDLETFAPVIAGVFGPSADRGEADIPDDGTRAPSLRYRIADRSIGSTNPVLKATTDLVALLAGRFDATSVLEFLASPPVRRRFRLTDDDLERITGWVDATRIRWGIDARHREGFGVPAGVAGNTWRAGLDRLLVGTAVHGDGLTLAVGEVAPFDAAIEDPTLLGRLAELLDTLDGLQRETTTPRDVAGWTDLVARAATTLLAVEPDQQWQVDQLLRVLSEVVACASDRHQVSSPTRLAFADLRRILEYELRGSPGRPNFFRGGITVTSMTPLRGLPYRVVCLLGMDEGAFPSGAVDGDDLVAAGPRVGDRDVRADARQALLEAVLAAGDRLVLVRSGYDVQKSHPTPPSVVVAELVDAVGAMVDPATRPAFLADLERLHPRQAFDPTCFTPDRPWSFDPLARAGAEARLRRTAVGPAPFLTAPLAPRPTGEITLDQLQGFFKHPVRTFLEQSLGVRLPRPEDRSEPVVPIDLNGLERWGAGDRLLTALLEGEPADRWEEFERQLGTLPPGGLAGAAVTDLRSSAGTLHLAAVNRRMVDGPGQPHPVDVTLDDGTRITGTVLLRLAPPGVGPCRVTFSRSKPEHEVASWLDLLALAATDPSTKWRSVTVGRGRGKVPTKITERWAAGDDEDERRSIAHQGLRMAVALYRRGLTEPLPLFATLSPSVARGYLAPNEWHGYQGMGDGFDPHNAFVFGGFDFDDLLAMEATDDDPPGPGGRVERLAHHLWDAIAATSVDPTAKKPSEEEGA